MHTTLGTTSAGGELGISLAQRLRHMAVIGATGSGKSTLLRHVLSQDIARGDGLLLLDPHGELCQAVAGDMPTWRHNHVCYLDCAEAEFPVGLNVLEDTGEDDRARAVDGLVSGMRSIWFESWGPRMEIILRHACTALIELPNASMVLIPRLLIDDEWRGRIVPRITNHDTRTFFSQRFENWRAAFRDEAIDPVLNKIESFLAFPTLKNILGQGRSTLSLTHAMNNRRIVLADLATGSLGESAARLMGALLLAHVRAAAMARARVPVAERVPFHLVIDEAHSFGPASIARLLAETRKYALSIILVTQFLDALSDAVRAAVLGNVATLAAFRSNPEDSALLARKFDRTHQHFNPTMLQELDDGEAYVVSTGLEPARIAVPAPASIRDSAIVRAQSRRHYGVARAAVEERLARALGYHATQR